jgi:hypothetical protein
MATLTMTACTAESPAALPGTTLDSPLRLTVTPPVGDGKVRLAVVTTVAGAANFRFFRRNGGDDDELPVTPAGDREFIWASTGLAPGVYTLWASAYSSTGRLLASSALTPLVLTPATATTLPPIRGVVRDAP